MNSEIVLNKDTVYVLSKIYENDARCRLENSVTLPEYKQDINRIIKVDIKPKITLKNVYVQSNSLFAEVEGIAVFNIIYEPEEKENGQNICGCTFYIDFKHTFKSNIEQDKIYDLDKISSFFILESENINCKLLGPRQILLRCDINIAAEIKTNEALTYYNPNNIDCLEKQTYTTKNVKILACGEKEFSLLESINLPKEYLPIKEIIDCDVNFVLDNSKTMNEKYVFSASLILSCSYIGVDEEELQYISFVQPFDISGLIENSDMEEDAFCDITFMPTLLKVDSDLNSLGENKQINIELKYTVSYCEYINQLFNTLTDCFSSYRNIDVGYDKIYTNYISSYINNSTQIKEKISLEEKYKSVESIKSKIKFNDCTFEEDAIIINGKIYLNMIVINENNSAFPFDHIIDFKYGIRGENSIDISMLESSKIEINGSVKNLDCDILNDEMLIKADITNNIKIYTNEENDVVSYVNDIGEKNNSDEIGIIYYYPNEEDTLWDIAKKYLISKEVLKRENNICDDSVPSIIKIYR